MFNALKTLYALFALMTSVVLLSLGNSAFGSFIVLRADLIGFSDEMIGVMSSAFFFGMIIGTLYCPRIIARSGHIRSFAAFSAISAATVLSFSLVTHVEAWTVLRAIMGFNVISMYVIVESWLNVRTSSENRAKVLSLYMMINYFAQGGSQQLLNIGIYDNDALFSLVAILLTLAVVPVALTRATNPDVIDNKRFGIRRLFEVSPTAVAGVFTQGLMQAPIFSLGSIYAKGIGLTTVEISLFMSITLMSGLLLQYPAGWLSDRFDRRKVIFSVTFIVATISTLMSISTSFPLLYLFIIMSILSGFSTTLFPLCMAYANDYVDANEMLKTAGGLNLAWGIGAAIGPLSAGMVMQWFGPAGLFIHGAVVATLFFSYILWRMTRRSWAPIEEKETFVPMPDITVSPIPNEIDPRIEAEEPLPLAGADPMILQETLDGQFEQLEEGDANS